MEKEVKGNLIYYKFSSLHHPQVMHGFSSRAGGVSTGYYSSLNLSFFSGDDTELVKENYRRFLKGLDLPFKQAVRLSLVHGADVAVITKEEAGAGLAEPHKNIVADGAITQQTGIPLIATFADCVPLFFFDPVERAVGIAHAGWRGTLKRIAAEMVGQFAQSFNTKPQHLRVGIGPSIGPCCFEVGEEVVAAFANDSLLSENVYKIKNNKYFLNLWQINKNILLQAGVDIKHIEISELCTKCHKDSFFSHRGHQGKRGAMAGAIALKAE